MWNLIDAKCVKYIAIVLRVHGLNHVTMYAGAPVCTLVGTDVLQPLRPSQFLHHRRASLRPSTETVKAMMQCYGKI